MIHCKKHILYIAPTLVISLGLTFSQAQVKETETLTPFEKGCSVCHSLEKIRLEMEKMIKEMHQNAGVQLSEETIKGIEETFTLKPVTEPHKALFQEKCASCHSLDKVVMAHQTKDEVEVERIIQRMANKEKSKISKEEIDKIHRSMNTLNEIYEKRIEVKPEQKE